MIKKIVITGDLLRLTPDKKHTDQITNIEWLYHLVSYGLSRASGLEVVMLHTKSDIAFDSRVFYKKNNLAPTPKEWVKIYDATPSVESIEYASEFFKDTFVVGFELPPVFLKVFEALNVEFVDAIIHPVRFLDDLVLGFRSSSKEIYRGLKKYQIDEELVYMQASIHSATVAKMKPLNLKSDSALFCGQVEVDKSLIDGGGLVCIEDYKESVSKLCEKYTHIYIKPHPYARDNDALKESFKGFRNVSFVEHNFYYMVAQKEIKAVYSLSSSTVYEAKYWHKDGVYFHKNPFFIDHDNSEFNDKEHIGIDDSFLSSAFWGDILGSVVETKQANSVKIPKKPNRLRNSLQSYWGYNFLDFEILLKSYNLYSADESVGDMLETLKPEVLKTKMNLKQRLERSKRFGYYKQKLKYMPIVGRFLYFIKHKVLRWH